MPYRGDSVTTLRPENLSHSSIELNLVGCKGKWGCRITKMRTEKRATTDGVTSHERKTQLKSKLWSREPKDGSSVFPEGATASKEMKSSQHRHVINIREGAAEGAQTYACLFIFRSAFAEASESEEILWSSWLGRGTGRETRRL